jgi:hypothetical protein
MQSCDTADFKSALRGTDNLWMHCFGFAAIDSFCAFGRFEAGF